MRNRYFRLFVSLAFSLFLISCSKYGAQLEEVLQLAGENRIELKKVLEHYRTDDEKYKAACFLIENMPFYGYYEGAKLNDYHLYYEILSDTLLKVQDVIDSLKRVNGEFSVRQLNYERDITTVDSAFLVNHIDWAFKVRREQPWGQSISFDDFCEYVLPYRIWDEPLSTWREELYNRYNPILDAVRCMPEAEDPHFVAQILYDSLSKRQVVYTSALPGGPHLGPMVVDLRVGTCRDFADMMIYAFRAVGLPCGIDRMLQRGDNNSGHLWNFVLDKNGNTYMAEFPFQKKIVTASKYVSPKGKVYRVTYSLNRKMMNTLEHDEMPYPTFKVPFLKDITSIYADSLNWSITIPTAKIYGKIDKGETVYLCLSHYKEWIPIGYAFASDDGVCFEDIEGGVVAVLGTWDGKKMNVCTAPFFIDRSTGKIDYYIGDKEWEKVVLYRKCHLSSLNYLYNRIVNGVIEGSNYSDFFEADTLWLIKKASFRLFTAVPLKADKPYRYFRYRGHKGTYCDIAELSFYENMVDTVPLKGRVIGTPGCYDDDGLHEYGNVFDGDPYTSFHYKERDNGWAGMDLGEKRIIRKAIYTPRNTRNFIEEGDGYELFYWHEGEWKSAGYQVATSDSLEYSVPRGVLLYLKNHSRGKDERIFDYKNGKQKFW